MRLLVLYSATVFLSAALLFWVQPLFGKLVLPLLGGSPETWNTCMVFFQAALLGGYGYAHWTTRRLGVRRQAMLHCLLILLPASLLPVGLPLGATPPSQSLPVGWLLGLLAISVGAPFLAVSTTAPLVQRWFAETGHSSAGDPYFLYAASNAGSMLALAAFPLLLEPNLRLSQQTWLWSAGYGLLAVLVIACAVIMLRSPGASSVPVPKHAARSAPERSIDARRRLRWLALSFVPSSWLLGVTAYLTTDIAPAPLLWIIPLALYLLSFILVFARRARVPHDALRRLFPVMLLLLVTPIVISGVWPSLALHLTAFLWGTLLCHGELARDRPSPSHLTEFYLCMSIGGVLGGVFNALLAPVLFPWTLEFPLAIALSAWLMADRNPTARRVTAGPLAALVAATLLVGVLRLTSPETERPVTLVLGIVVAMPVLAGLFVLGRNTSFCVVLALCLVAGEIAPPFSGDVLYTGRGYFGVHRVLANQDEQGVVYHHLVHGATVHGRQARTPSRECEPLTYYHPSGPLGDVFKSLSDKPPRQVAIVGLGTGAMACYAREGDQFTFYEIDPLVRQVAGTPEYFGFLSQCMRGKYEIVLGDGRLQLAPAATHSYDLMIFDAFSSDAVPVHLLTREAITLYESKLADGGCLVFHASNAHLDLESVLAALAADLGFVCASRRDVQLTMEEFLAGKTPSTYVVIARQRRDLGRLLELPTWQERKPAKGTPLWTDDYSNILGALKWQRE